MQIQHNIGVTVKTDYVRNQSDPDNARYVFAYTITIKNNGSASAQLLRRRWLITDANDKIQEVQGDGVVGKQPHLQPGDTFTYTSAAMIETPFGYMQGNRSANMVLPAPGGPIIIRLCPPAAATSIARLA